jgi:hypothetical protein
MLIGSKVIKGKLKLTYRQKCELISLDLFFEERRLIIDLEAENVDIYFNRKSTHHTAKFVHHVMLLS